MYRFQKIYQFYIILDFRLHNTNIFQKKVFDMFNNPFPFGQIKTNLLVSWVLFISNKQEQRNGRLWRESVVPTINQTLMT